MTKRWFLARLLAAGTAAAALSVGLVLPAHAADETPDALVQRLSSEVLEALRNDKSIKAGDVDKIMVLVDKIIMPPIGLLVGGVDFSKWAWTLKEATVDAAGKEVPAVAIGIGEFLNTVIQFVIVAFAIFLLVRAVNRLHRKPEAAPAAPPEDVLLLREIRDALKK